MNTWPKTLLDALNAADVATEKRWVEDLPRNWGLQLTVGTLKSSIDTFLLSHTIYPEFHEHIFLINMGMNDAIAGGMVEATWKSDYQYIIDAIVTQYPDADLYIAKPYGEDYAANCATLAGWIDDLVAANPTTCHAGHDESTWAPAVDDADKIHYYNAAGQTACAAQWYAILHP